MTSQKFTVIYYYVPEDHDDPSIPNAFGIQKNQKEIKYKDIEESFPLEGQYIFRFKYKHGKKIVWLDLQNKKDSVPTFERMIFLKVTRINWGKYEEIEEPVEKTKQKVEEPDEEELIGGGGMELGGGGVQDLEANLMDLGGLTQTTSGNNNTTAQTNQEPDLFAGIDLAGMTQGGDSGGLNLL